MNLLFIVCALLTITASLFYRIHTTKSLKWKKEIPVVAITLSINFLGLLAALYLNRIEIRSQEKDSTVKLMKAAYADIAKIYYHIKETCPYLDVNKISGNYICGNVDYDYFIQTPELFFSLINNEIILRNISYETLSFLSVGIGNLKEYARICSLPNKKDSTIFVNYGFYCDELKYLGNTLRAEILYQNKDISKDQLIELQENEFSELTGIVGVRGYSSYVEHLMTNIKSIFLH